MAYGDTIFQDADATGFDWWNWYDQTAGLGGFQEPQMPGTPPDVVQMDPFVVSEPAGTSFEDYLSGIGPSNIFDYGAGTITPGFGQVTFGPQESSITPGARYLQPLPGGDVTNEIYNQRLADINTARARAGNPPLMETDANEIGALWDDVQKQVTQVYDLAQQDLDRAQAARQVAQTGGVIPLPLPIPPELAGILNAAQLADLIGRVYGKSTLGVETPLTPQEVVSQGGDLSQIGTVGLGPIPAGGGSVGGISQMGNQILGQLGGLLAGAGGLIMDPSGLLGGGGGGGGGGATPAQGTTTTGPVVVTPGATGGNTGTGSSTPSVTNPAGTDTTSGISLSGVQPSDMGPFGLPGGDNPLVIGQESPEQKAAREAAESQAAQARTDAAAVTQQQIDAAKQRESEAAARAQQERETLLRIMGQNQPVAQTTVFDPNQPISLEKTGLPPTDVGPFGIPTTTPPVNPNVNPTTPTVNPVVNPTNPTVNPDVTPTNPTVNPVITPTNPTNPVTVNPQEPGSSDNKTVVVSQCPPGQVRNADGVCVVPGTTPKTSVSSTETPTTDTNVVVNPINESCPEGQERVNGQCVARCPAGQVRNAAGACVVAPGVTPGPTVNPGETPTPGPNTVVDPECPPGTEKVNGQCVARCPAGQTRNAAGVCVVATTTTSTTATTTPTSSIFTIPTSTYTPSLMATTPAQRNILTEGTTTTAAFTQLAPQFSNMYGGLATGYQREDEDRLYRMAMGGSPFAQAQLGLTGMASAQTQAANRALRAGNLADVQAMQAQALAARRAANPELYGALGQLTQQAQQQAASDYGRMQTAGQLSAEDIRNAQQAAREAYGARGQAMSKGAVGAEILNRQQLQQQREQQARQNYQQSLGNLGAATQMQTANLFDPFSTLLGQQYGMQSQNVGTTQGLFGQAGALASGGLSYAPVVQTYNPFGVYPQDVYGTNVNALNADQIAAANRQAALEAAKLGQTGTYAQALGSFLGTQTGQNSINSIVDFIRRSVGG